ncbi:MAG: phospholipid carrier-dependent glycosyltransferase [Anaerolineales bacterium]|nr:phospholipid carrier-dependent glycosyltransferase [Anaerolineales bacterium]
MLNVIRVIKNKLNIEKASALFIFLLTVTLIFYRLDEPQAIVFDETYHIPSAQKYLNGVFFQEYHPPLGKLLIAFGYYASCRGDITNNFIEVEKIAESWPANLNITCFRFAPAVFGTFIPLFFYFLIKKITGNFKIALSVSLLLLFDTTFLTQSRIAMLDVFLLFFILASLYYSVVIIQDFEKNKKRLILYAFFVGCAISVKYTGLVALIPFLFWIVKNVIEKRARQRFKQVVFVFFIVGAVFLLWWQVHFVLAVNIVSNHTYKASTEHLQVVGDEYLKGNLLSNFVVRLTDSIRYHINHNEGVPSLRLGQSDEIGSPWYQWMVGGKAINYRWETPDSVTYRYIYLVPNIVTWLISLLGGLLGSAIFVSDILFGYLKKSREKVFLEYLVILYWGYIVPFWLIQRVMYLYHYIPGMVFGLLLWAAVLNILQKEGKKIEYLLAITALAAVIIFFLLSPFVYYLPLTNAQFEIRNIWPIWELRCVQCL